MEYYNTKLILENVQQNLLIYIAQPTNNQPQKKCWKFIELFVFYYER